MARKSQPKRRRADTGRTRNALASDLPPRQRIVAALMELLAENPIEQIGLAAVASHAGVTLSQLREEFSSVIDILGAHVKAIDRIVLDGVDSALADEPARERLFEILMRRLEAMTPYRAAIHSLLRSAWRNPGLAFTLNGLAVGAQRWMLTAAGIDTAGPKGMMRAQGLALLFSGVLRVFVEDDDPDLSRTMAALDRELTRGQRWSGFLDDLFAVSACVRRPRRRRRGRADMAAA
ncbi:MAG: TetR/AcrR family transcriptional regulator [Pseudorhodoplanes sp.]